MTRTSPVEATLCPPSPLLASPAIRLLLTRYIARWVPACDVDDVVQATLCDALASGRAPEHGPDLQRFLLSIAHSKVVDALRLAGRAVPAEAEGDKLEAIAANEELPAERVRQRVSRLRRWMRERWVAELALVASLAVVALAVIGTMRRRYEAILPEAADGAPVDARFPGTWQLVSFTPAAPLPAAQKALADQLAQSLILSFDGRTLVAADGTFSIVYVASVDITRSPQSGHPASAGNGRIDLVETAAPGRPVSVTYSWDGDGLVVTAPAGKWAGVARFRLTR